MPDQSLETWDKSESGAVFIHIINSEQYEELTGQKPPPTPVSAETYTRYGFPWFELYDEESATLAASEKLAEVKSIREKKRRGEEKAVKISPAQIKKIKPKRVAGSSEDGCALIHTLQRAKCTPWLSNV